MNKQHHIIYERYTGKYWFILPDDTEIEVLKKEVEKIDFNKVYNKIYQVYLSDRKIYNKLIKRIKEWSNNNFDFHSFVNGG